MFLAIPSFRRCFTDQNGNWRHPPGLGVLGMGDDPPELFPYPLPDQHGKARKIADALVEGCVGGELVAVLSEDVVLDEKEHVVGGRLFVHRAVHGNKPKKRR